MAPSEEAEGKRIPATREQDQGDCKKRGASGKGKGRASSGNRSECAYAKGSASTDNWIHRVRADK